MYKNIELEKIIRNLSSSILSFFYTFVASAHNGVAFDVPELFLERRIIGFPIGNMPFERLLSSAFLVSIGFPFLFHRQCSGIKDPIFEHAIEGAHEIIDGHLFAADHDIRCQALSHLVLNISPLFLR